MPSEANARIRIANYWNICGLLIGVVVSLGPSSILVGFSEGALLLATGFLGVRASIYAFRVWKQSQKSAPPSAFSPLDGEGPPPFDSKLMFLPLLVAFLVTTGLGAAFYANQFRTGPADWLVIVDSLNYSVQTVTTVGYGNWTPDGVAFHDARLVAVKFFSVMLMLDGTALWAILIGMITGWFTNVND
jgi:hypothetical protein